LIDALYKKVARDNILQPTFIIGHPISLSPLARANESNPAVTDRFQLVINGWEIINAYSELVDPLEQRKRLQQQATLKDSGDQEAMMMDEDYLKAMEYGLPPISGWGMGIDRITALLTNSENIKDCVLFPLMKSKEKSNQIAEPINQYEDIKDPGISYQKAKELLISYIPTTDPLFKHSLAVEAIMKKLALVLKQPEEVWAIAGLLHDLDYLETKNKPSEHGLVSEKILSKIGVHPEIVYAVKAHNYLHELSLHTLLAKALYSVEELAGLITACALVQPNKSLHEVTLQSLQKKFKQAAFASGVNRAIIKKSEDFLNLKLANIMEISLQAMTEISKDLDL
jgi:putative nucleotidyltransferase with HDIG domain